MEFRLAHTEPLITPGDDLSEDIHIVEAYLVMGGSHKHMEGLAEVHERLLHIHTLLHLLNLQEEPVHQRCQEDLERCRIYTLRAQAGMWS